MVEMDFGNAMTPERPESLAYGAELLPLVLLACCRWPDRALDDMPLGYLHDCPKSKWVEAVGRLQGMGMLKSRPDAGKPQRLTGMGGRAVGWLPHVTWRLACFLAHMRDKSTILERRVFIRLTAIIEFEVPVIVTRMTARVMRAVIDAACGPASEMVAYGQLWVALSLWERHRRLKNDFAKTGACASHLFEDLVQLDDSVEIHRMVCQLEAALSIPAATTAEMDQKLPAASLLLIQQDLFSGGPCCVAGEVRRPRRRDRAQRGQGGHLPPRPARRPPRQSLCRRAGHLSVPVVRACRQPGHRRRPYHRARQKRMGANSPLAAVMSLYAHPARLY